MAMQENDLRRPPQDRFDPDHMAVLNKEYPNPIPFEPGAQIIKRGASGEDERDLFVVVEGRALVFVNEAKIPIGPGGFFGEMVLIAHIVNRSLEDDKKISIARSADVSAGENGLKAIRLSPEAVLRWREKGFPYSDMYRVVSDQAQHRTALLANREEVGMDDIWSTRLLPESKPQLQIEAEPEVPIEVPMASIAQPTEVFRGVGGPLGRRLNRKTTNL